MKITKLDYLVVVLLILVSLFFMTNHADGDKKLFLISEEEKKQIPLETGLIKLDDGDVIIEVTTEGARFIESDCPNKTCIHSGWVNKCGQTAACVPNRYALVIECSKEGEYDAISR